MREFEKYALTFLAGVLLAWAAQEAGAALKRSNARLMAPEIPPRQPD